jgi:hypothetical protein
MLGPNARAGIQLNRSATSTVIAKRFNSTAFLKKGEETFFSE